METVVDTGVSVMVLADQRLGEAKKMTGSSFPVHP